ncbi:MAG: succinate dehydrogenase, cytochrome b556 subunit [Pseudomonadota bacterium]
MAGSSWTDERPKSPHLQIWRWHATMYGSILHRVTGVGLYGGALLIAAWIVALATGPEAYALVETVVYSPFGKILMFLWTMAVLYHMANGLRHLIWDGPQKGFTPSLASTWSLFNFAFATLGAAIIWSLASMAQGG